MPDLNVTSANRNIPNDEIVQHIHQKHPEKDSSTYSCWTCGIKFRKVTAMKHHMKTVKHQLEAKKYLITEESTDKTEVQLILIEADLLNEIQIENTPQILTTEAPTEQTNKLIITSEMNQDIGPIICLNTLEDQLIITTESTGEQEEEKITDSDDPKNNAGIENVVKNLLRAINEDQAENMEDEKNKIITQYHQDGEIVDLETDDWLIMHQWGKTPAIEEMIPVNFEDL